MDPMSAIRFRSKKVRTFSAKFSSMDLLLDTDRICLRKMRPSDFDGLYELASDPEVMKFSSLQEPMTEAQVREVFKKIIGWYHEWREYGVWAAELKATGNFIGWFALKPLPGTSEIEVGYRLQRKHWGHGYATEVVRKLVEHGLRSIGLKKIVAITAPENKASIRVLEKTGFKYLGELDYQPDPSKPKAPVPWFELSLAE